MGKAMRGRFVLYMNLIAMSTFVQMSTAKCLKEFKVKRHWLSSLEVSSFSQLEMINSRGTYHVGCPKSNNSPPRSIVTTNDCVKVAIEYEGEESACSGKVYLLNDLLDLQSKLMLISGRGDKSKADQVQVFMDVRIDLVYVFLVVH